MIQPTIAASSGLGSWLVPLITLAAFAGAAVAAARPKAAASTRALRAAPVDIPAGQREPRQLEWLETGLLAVVAGYIMFDRPFAWIHVPGTPLFVGEMVIGIGVLALLTTHTSAVALLRQSVSLKALRNYMLWGAALLALNVLPYGLDAIRDSALWYYGMFAIFVVILLASRPDRANDWITRFSKLVRIYLLWFPLAVVLAAAGPRSINVPDSNINIFNHKSGNIAVLCAIAIAFMWMADADNRLFTRRQRIGLTSLATLMIVFTGLQNRGGMVSSAVLIAALLFLLSSRRSELIMLMVAALVITASVAIVFDVKIELFGDREISVTQFTNNISSILDPEAGGERQSSTTAWRLNIWQQVLDDVTNETPVMGFGPGPDLGERYEISTNPAAPLRNPHNSHVGILARLGWVGVILWAMLWITWMAEMQTLRRRLRRRGRTTESGIASWIMVSPIPILINAIFDPTLEGAQVAVVMWTIYGFGAALVLLNHQNRLPEFTAGVGSRSARRYSQEAAPRS